MVGMVGMANVVGEGGPHGERGLNATRDFDPTS